MTATFPRQLPSEESEQVEVGSKPNCLEQYLLRLKLTRFDIGAERCEGRSEAMQVLAGCPPVVVEGKMTKMPAGSHHAGLTQQLLLYE